MFKIEDDDALMLMFQDKAEFCSYLKDNSNILSEFKKDELDLDSSNSKKSPEKSEVIWFLNDSPEGLYK